MPGLGGLVTTRFKLLGVAGPSMFKTGSPPVHLSIEYSPSLLYGFAASTEPLQADPVNPTPILFLRSLFEARKAASILLESKRANKKLDTGDANLNCSESVRKTPNVPDGESAITKTRGLEARSLFLTRHRAACRHRVMPVVCCSGPRRRSCWPGPARRVRERRRWQTA
jgi:hypothetical protein